MLTLNLFWDYTELCYIDIPVQGQVWNKSMVFSPMCALVTSSSHLKFFFLSWLTLITTSYFLVLPYVHLLGKPNAKSQRLKLSLIGWLLLVIFFLCCTATMQVKAPELGNDGWSFDLLSVMHLNCKCLYEGLLRYLQSFQMNTSCNSADSRGKPTQEPPLGFT